MEGGLLLDVVISECATVFKLLTGKDKPLLIRRDSFLILDLSFNIVNSIRIFNLQSDDDLTSCAVTKTLNVGLSKS
ncbi:unnamed protein product [Arabidopsis thaliana]|uniref:Uncharacterized protein n=1 Tax=Arabidopsis thaliana TaxID=3702 RepID=A0A654EWW6_ARATH|nr:unnamed protein product [Arabidopsis thaliana]